MNLKQKGFFVVLFTISIAFLLSLIVDVIEDKILIEKSFFLYFTISTLITIITIVILLMKIGFATDRNKILYKVLFLKHFPLIKLKLKTKSIKTYTIKELVETKYNNNSTLGTKDIIFKYEIYKFMIDDRELITLYSLDNKNKLYSFLKSNTNLIQVSS